MASGNLMKLWHLLDTTLPPSNSTEAAQKLTMRHLVWETKSVQSEKRCSSQPSCGVVAVDSVMQRACICPHFALWNAGAPKDFLLNDMLDLWPDLSPIPQDGAANIEQQQPTQQQHLLQPSKRLR